MGYYSNLFLIFKIYVSSYNFFLNHPLEEPPESPFLQSRPYHTGRDITDDLRSGSCLFREQGRDAQPLPRPQDVALAQPHPAATQAWRRWRRVDEASSLPGRGSAVLRWWVAFYFPHGHVCTPFPSGYIAPRGLAGNLNAYADGSNL